MTELQTMPLRFRVWDREEKKFVRSVTISGPQIWPCRFNLASGYFEMDSNERFIISQDTGLKDKNGVDIFTGDIVYYDYYEMSAPISYGCGMVVMQLSDDDDYYISQHLDAIEVVGNIWKNGELLEEK